MNIKTVGRVGRDKNVEFHHRFISNFVEFISPTEIIQKIEI